MISAGSKPDGKLEWTLLGNDKVVKSLMHELDQENVVGKVVKVSKLEDEKELTARQENILQIGLEKGYFEFPKKITLRQLAKTLGIAPRRH